VEHVPRRPPGGGIALYKGLDIDHGFGRQFLKNAFDELGDAQEGQRPGKKRIHCNLVGRVEDGRGIATRP
jgi:hypothetical protein